jgi:hypothetical protein
LALLDPNADEDDRLMGGAVIGLILQKLDMLCRAYVTTR